MLLNRDAILQVQDLPHEDVEVPEWGGTVRVRALTGAERDAFEGNMVERRGKLTKMNLRNIRAKLIALTVIDEEGKRLFSDSDVEALGKKSALVLNKIFEVAQRLSGIRPEDMEEIEKN